MRWERRRDLEGGKELGVWLLVSDSGDVEKELYVESHEYRDDGFDVHVAKDGEWKKRGVFDGPRQAFSLAYEILDESPYPIDKIE